LPQPPPDAGAHLPPTPEGSDGGATPGDTRVLSPDDGARTAQTAEARPLAARPRKRKTLAPELAAGTVVGRYVVLRTLGRGGMGVVYEAHDPELNRHVALKLIDKRSEDGRDRLLREAQALAKLSHPNVVAIHDVGTHQDTVFLAMELVKGQTLRKWLREHKPEWRRIREVLLAAGRGLAAAHRARLVHRDFKPDNVMVDGEDRVWVLDFGLARAADRSQSFDAAPGDGTFVTPQGGARAAGSLGEGSAGDDESAGHESGSGELGPHASGAHDTDPSSKDSLIRSVGHSRLHTPLTQAGAIMGTPSYMAPEQHVGGEVDEFTDQFNFCVTAYEAFFGKRPFRGSSLVELREEVATRGPTPPPASSRVPRRIRRTVLRGLAKDPAARFGSMDALLGELAYEPRVLRRRLAVGASVVILAGVATLALPRSQAPPPPCRAGQARLAGVWDKARRAAVEAAFAQTGRVYAPQTFVEVARRLDAYASRWVTAYDGACAATHVRYEQSEKLLDLRMRCLERRRAKLGAFTALLGARQSPEIVDGAVRAADGLDSLDACADAEALEAATPLPADLKLRAAIEELDRAIDENDVALGAGDIATATKAAPGLVERARTLGYEPTLALAVYHLGMAKQFDGQYPAAEDAYLTALDYAAQARDDRLSAQIWVDLVHVVGYSLGRHDEALRLARFAKAALSRAGDAADLEAQYAYRLGVLYDITGKPGEAEPLLERAISLRVAQLGAQSPTVGRLRATLALILSRQGQTDAAHALFLAALASLEHSLGPGHPDVALVLSNTGYNLENAGRIGEALPYYQRSLVLMEAVYRPDHARLALPLGNLGSAALATKRWAEACGYFERSLAIEERELGPEHPDLAYALSGLGECRLELGQVEPARAALERALVLRDKNEVLPDERGLTRFALAKVLWATPAERPRARSLAKKARADFVAATSGPPGMVAKIDGWLAAHGGP
jgi:serine/threonine protein kinase/tetratricopeptide (TPR) repeat protein